MPPTLPGLDALRAGHHSTILEAMRGRRVGLLTNHTGRALDGAPALEVLRQLNVDVVALFSPEHGPRGTEEGDIASATSAEGLPIHSLYGATRRPTAAMLSGLDVLVCDLQDVGARFYTYFATVAHCLDEAVHHGITVVVLDRPNPLGGQAIEGPTLEPACRSFVGYAQTPIIHGLTLAELARWYLAERQLTVPLLCGTCLHWERGQLWPETLPWRRPSPNLPDFAAAAWYPSLCLAEFSDLSVGRGTAAPFQILAAPWLRAAELRERLLELQLFPALEVSVLEVTPALATHAGQACPSIQLRQAAPPERPAALGLTLLALIGQLHPQWRTEKLPAARPLVGSDTVMSNLIEGDITAALRTAGQDAQTFRAARKPALLYPE